MDVCIHRWFEGVKYFLSQIRPRRCRLRRRLWSGCTRIQRRDRTVRAEACSGAHRLKHGAGVDVKGRGEQWGSLVSVVGCGVVGCEARRQERVGCRGIALVLEVDCGGVCGGSSNERRGVLSRHRRQRGVLGER